MKSTSNPVIDRLRKIPMFSSCSDRELERVDRLATVVDVGPERVLYREGDIGRQFVIVIEGSLNVSRCLRTIDQIGVGDSYGETALIDPDTRTATVATICASELLVFNPSEFATLLEVLPRVRQEIVALAAGRVESAGTETGEDQILAQDEVLPQTGVVANRGHGRPFEVAPLP